MIVGIWDYAFAQIQKIKYQNGIQMKTMIFELLWCFCINSSVIVGNANTGVINNRGD